MCGILGFTDKVVYVQRQMDRATPWGSVFWHTFDHFAPGTQDGKLYILTSFICPSAIKEILDPRFTKTCDPDISIFPPKLVSISFFLTLFMAWDRFFPIISANTLDINLGTSKLEQQHKYFLKKKQGKKGNHSRWLRSYELNLKT